MPGFGEKVSWRQGGNSVECRGSGFSTVLPQALGIPRGRGGAKTEGRKEWKGSQALPQPTSEQQHNTNDLTWRAPSQILQEEENNAKDPEKKEPWGQGFGPDSCCCLLSGSQHGQLLRPAGHISNGPADPCTLENLCPAHSAALGNKGLLSYTCVIGALI